jgi:site-specific recombinase XerD
MHNRDVAALIKDCVRWMKDEGGWGEECFALSPYLSIQKYFQSQGQESYDEATLERFKKFQDGREASGEICRNTLSRLLSAADRLSQFASSGKVSHGAQVPKKPKFIVGAEFEDALSGHLKTLSAKEASKRAYGGTLRMFLSRMEEFGCCSLELITPELVGKFLSSDRKAKKLSSLSAEVFRIKRFCLWLSEEGLSPPLLSAFPLAVAGGTAYIPAITEQELDAVMSCIDRSTAIGKRDYAMFQLILCTGIRGCDALALKLDRLDLEKGEMRIVQQKTGKILDTAILPEASLALADYIENGRPQAEGVDNVFIRHVHPFAAMSRAHVVFKRYKEMAGITKTLGFHSLRRKLGKDLVRSGAPPEIVAELLGHVDVESVAPYVRLNEEDLRGCASDFGDIPLAKEDW